MAETFPSHPVTLLVTGPAGGTTDFTARLIATPLSARLGVPVVVDNRAGGNGVPALVAASRARPDGHTLLVGYCGTITGRVAVDGPAEFDPRRELAAVATLIEAPQVMLVHPSLPVTTLAEFIAYAKQRPGQLNYASSGNGSMQHLGTELLKRRTGIDLVHVPYRGTGETMNDVLAGRVQFYMTTPPPVAPFVRDGKLRALAMASPERHPAMPGVPTVAEAGLPGYSAEAWFGLFAPPGTPRPLIERIAAECAVVLQDETVRRRALDTGTFTRFEGPDVLTERVGREITGWTELVRAQGIKSD